jgi:Mg-chelatase subunit ChlD
MKDYTHICIVLDASGSMSSIEDDTKGSFNSFIKAQREAGGKTVFDLYQFSDEVKRLVEHVDLATFKDDLMARYNCSGCTALNDAVCIAIDTLGKELAAMKEEDRPENVLMVIITDGFENASRQFSSKDVKDRIKHQTEKYNWEFQYLAANQDAFASGADLGIAKDNCVNFAASAAGMVQVCASMCDRATQVRNRSRKKN